MFFSATFILALVSLLVTPVFSAPIYVHGGSNSMTSHPVNAGLEKRSPMFWGQGHHHDSTTIVERDVLEYSGLVARDDSSILEARSTDRSTRSSLAKRAEGKTVRLVRRKNIFTSIKEGLQKSGAAIKKGFQKAGQRIKKVAQKIGNNIKTDVRKVGSFFKTTGARIASFGVGKIPGRGAFTRAATRFATRVASSIAGERNQPEPETRSPEDGASLEETLI